MPEYSVIDTQEGFQRALATLLAGNGPIAVDAERASGFRYSQRAYLIQFYRRQAGVFLFDAPAIGRFDALNDVFSDELWVLHAASQDLPCLREVGLDPSQLFDTELSCRLLGMPRVGLGTVTAELLGIHLAKEHSAADWSTRPLPQEWLAYAASDVEVLIDLHDVLANMLREENKVRIADEEFHATLVRAPKPPLTEPWRRLSKVHALKQPTALAVARELWLARDDLGKSRDIAVGRLIPDSSIVAAASAPLHSKRDLARLRSFTGKESRTEIDRWWDAIERGRANATSITLAVREIRDEVPPPRHWEKKNPTANARLALAKQSVQRVAEELRLPVENLLTQNILRRLAWSPPEPLEFDTVALALTEQGARPWQVEAVSQSIADAFAAADRDALTESNL